VLSAAAALSIGCGGEAAAVRVSEGPAGAYEASLIAAGGGLAVAWYDTRDGHSEIYERALAGDGHPSGPERRLTAGTGSAYEADLQEDAGNLVVAWYEKSSTGALQPKLGRWTQDGVQRWVTTVAPKGRNAIARVHAGRVFAAWVVDEDNDAAAIWGGWWDAAGRPIGAASRIAAAGRTTWNLNASIDAAGRPWVVFDGHVGTRMEELFLVVVDGGTPRVSMLTPDDGFASKYPDLALSGERAALTWFDERDGNQEVYLAVLPAAAFATQVQQRAQRVTNTPGDSFGAYVAWNRDRVGLAWSDASSGQAEVFFADFDRRGQPLAPTRQVTSSPAASLIPCIRAWQDGFALAWNETELEQKGGHGGGGGHSTIHVTLVH
jgi:hypothetical protein